MPILSGQPDPALGLRAVTETFTSLSSELSLNFGNGNGWSYLSGGIGVSTWSIVPDGAAPLPVDEERQEDHQLRRRRTVVRQEAPRLQPRRSVLRDRRRHGAEPHFQPARGPSCW